MKTATCDRGVIRLGNLNALVVDDDQLALIKLLLEFHEGLYENHEDALFNVGIFEEVLELMK